MFKPYLQTCPTGLLYDTKTN
ncbi:Flocculation protein FLO1, partial [Danaus plexippus plexippus]